MIETKFRARAGAIQHEIDDAQLLAHVATLFSADAHANAAVIEKALDVLATLGAVEVANGVIKTTEAFVAILRHLDGSRLLAV